VRARLDEHRAELSRILDRLSIEERVELRESIRGGRDEAPLGGYALAARDVIAAAEREERDGLLPVGSARNLREVVVHRLT
jgi:hypothetical protein